MIAKIKKNRNRAKNKLRRKNIAKLISSFSYFFIGLLVLLIIIFLAYTNINITRRRIELTDKTKNLRTEIQVLEQKNEELRNKLDSAQTPDFLEKRLREEFGYGRPGEEKVIITLPEQITTEFPTKVEKTFWQSLKNWLGF